MGDAGGPQLLDNHPQHFPLQPFDLSPDDVLPSHVSFGFSPGTSPAPNHVKDEAFDTFFDPSTCLLELGRPGLLSASDLPYSSSPSKRQCFSRTAQALHQPGRLEILPSNQEKHGQLTPPSETTPTRSLQSDAAKGAPFDGRREKPIPGPNTRKRRAAVRSQPEKPAVQPIEDSHRRKKARKPESKAVAGQDEKRNQFLERNRIAASKCRQKKKEWTANLENRARQLQASKTSLAMLVSSLREELLYLKGEALKHTTCDCCNIREYLARPSTTSFARNYLDNAHSPASPSNLSFTGPDSSIVHDSPHSSAMPDDQALAELGILDDLPD